MNLPKENGESLITPPFQEWSRLIEGNFQLINSYRFDLAGIPFLKVRENLRKRLALYRIQPGNPLLLTGHQPHFVHPGIWFRFFLLERAREELGISSAAFVLDSDLNWGLTVRVPFEFQGELVSKEIALTLENKVYESLSSPRKEDWERFTKEIEGSLNFPEAISAKENFSKIERFSWKEEPFSAFYSRLRRYFEGEPDYPEFPLSEILKEEFRFFFLHIARNADTFARIYNAANARWRKERKARSENLPFPDLRNSEREVELPFWYLNDGERLPLFLDSRSNLKAEERVLGKLEDALESYKIRPRAATLTMFLRLMACDLFLHGLGGGDYEEAVDFMIRDFFQVEPPLFAKATITLFFPGFDFKERKRLGELIRKMRKNPERYLSSEVAQKERELILRKEELKEKKLDRDGYQELQRINRSLLNFLEGDIQLLEGQVRRLEQREEVLAFREYPFFFFNPEEVRLRARSA